MKPMELEATKWKVTLKKDEERKEQEQEDKERVATTEEILMNKTVPVSNEVKRIVLKIRKATLN